MRISRGKPAASAAIFPTPPRTAATHLQACLSFEALTWIAQPRLVNCTYLNGQAAGTQTPEDDISRHRGRPHSRRHADIPPATITFLHSIGVHPRLSWAH